MNIFKKSAAALCSALCMLVIVGYVNYEYNSEREKNLGKTVYVSTNSAEVIKVNDNNQNDGYIYASLNLKENIQNIKENTAKLQKSLEEKGYNVFVTYNINQNKYYIYTDENSADVIINESRSILECPENRFVVNIYWHNITGDV